MLSAIYTIHKWRQSKSEQHLCDSLTNLIDRLAESLADGDISRINAIRPIARDLVREALTHFDSSVSVDVANLVRIKFE